MNPKISCISQITERLIFRRNLISFIIIAGGIARIAIALMRSDAVWPDEHFQALEPASKIVFGRAVLAWEWLDGYRSWTLPLLYVPVLWFCKISGANGGLAPILASRFFTAIFSTWALWRFHQGLVLLRIRQLTRLIIMAVLSLGTPMVLWGPATLADNWVMIGWCALMPAILRLSRSEQNADWGKLGFLGGILFLIKPQAGILILGLGFCLLSLSRPHSWRRLFTYCLGVAITIAILGAIDMVSYGKPLGPLLQQFTRGESISRTFGTSPWYDYLERIKENQGSWFIFFLSISFLGALPNWRKVNSLSRVRILGYALMLVPGLAYFVFHMSIPHKETRFLLPTFPALYVLWALLLSSILTRHKKYLIVMRNQWIQAFTYVLVLALTIVTIFLARSTPLYLTSTDISTLEAKVYQMRAASPSGESCVLVVDHDWSWTRGKLILGEGVQMTQKKSHELTSRDFQICEFAILPAQTLKTMAAHLPRSWRQIEQAPNRYVLVKTK